MELVSLALLTYLKLAVACSLLFLAGVVVVAVVRDVRRPAPRSTPTYVEREPALFRPALTYTRGPASDARYRLTQSPAGQTRRAA